MNIKKTKLNLPRAEAFIIFFIALSIPLSKPLIYLSILSFIILSTIKLISDKTYRSNIFQSYLFWASTGVFVFGLISTAIGSGYAEDIIWMLSKTMLLPMAVPLLLAFRQETNRTAAISGVVLGFWIAFFLTARMHNWSWTGERYEGATWLIDAWAVICALLIALLTPLVFIATSNNLWRTVLAATLLGATLMLITTGARGPWLGAAAGVFVYLIMRQRSALLSLSVLTIASILAAQLFWPTQFEKFEQRVYSITDTQTDASNYLRLAMWETGYALIKKQMLSGEKGFWFGYKKKGRGDLANEFYYNEFIDQAKIKPGILKEYNWKITDFHNSYLESIFRNGILWTLGSLFILSWFAIGPIEKEKSMTQSWSAAPLLLCFLVTGVTYTLLPHFAFLFLIFFIALARGFSR